LEELHLLMKKISARNFPVLLRAWIGCYLNNQQQPSLLFPSKLGRLEMKPHEPKTKNKYKTKAKNKGKTKGVKKTKSKKEENTIKR
jgi:hypothetical protein